jgi:hypothetical protein
MDVVSIYYLFYLYYFDDPGTTIIEIFSMHFAKTRFLGTNIPITNLTPRQDGRKVPEGQWLAGRNTINGAAG